MKKQTVVIGLVLLVAAIGLFVFFFTYTVSGKVADVATLQPVAGVTLSIGDHIAKTAADGTYTIAGIKLYQKKNMTVAVPAGYTSHADVVVSYAGRSTTQNVGVTPTLISIITTVNQSQDKQLPGYLWRFMHPDDQAKWTAEQTYATDMKALWDYAAKQKDVITNTKATGPATNLARWTNPISGITYTNVYSIPISYQETIGSKTTTQTRTDYYQEINGFYHYFAGTSAVVVQQAVAAIAAK